ncbi:hypothetical protein SCOCK_180038 [Actinacidiphila cocklensis]|uniref:Uncharacterized protein n=1 Tax=Actinacidiphila cocklensis TaxID=887465 RepID=A0A9W4DSD6_9ACTN|nr:hypothetical protein SCOCK_180038 [Actinacidiphila cocklensis]
MRGTQRRARRDRNSPCLRAAPSDSPARPAPLAAQHI